MNWHYLENSFQEFTSNLKFYLKPIRFNIRCGFVELLLIFIVCDSLNHNIWCRSMSLHNSFIQGALVIPWNTSSSGIIILLLLCPLVSSHQIWWTTLWWNPNYLNSLSEQRLIVDAVVAHANRCLGRNFDLKRTTNTCGTRFKPLCSNANTLYEERGFHILSRLKRTTFCSNITTTKARMQIRLTNSIQSCFWEVNYWLKFSVRCIVNMSNLAWIIYMTNFRQKKSKIN